MGASPAAMSMPRKERSHFAICGFLTLTHSMLYREAERCLYFLSPIISAYFFYFFLVSWKSESLLFATCLPSYMRRSSVFTVPGWSSEQIVFPLRERKPTQRSQALKASVQCLLCPQDPSGKNIEPRWVSGVTISHYYGHQGTADMEKGVELSRQRKGEQHLTQWVQQG